MWLDIQKNKMKRKINTNKHFAIKKINNITHYTHTQVR